MALDEVRPVGSLEGSKVGELSYSTLVPLPLAEQPPQSGFPFSSAAAHEESVTATSC